MAKKGFDELMEQIDSLLPSNVPIDKVETLRLRKVLLDMVDSSYNIIDSEIRRGPQLLVVGFDDPVVVQDDAYLYAIPEEFDGNILTEVIVITTTSGSGGMNTEIMIHNNTVDVDMLFDNLTIPIAGLTATTIEEDIDFANAFVAKDNVIAVNIENTPNGDAPLGMIVVIRFVPFTIPLPA